jgi:hypothetical protein
VTWNSAISPAICYLYGSKLINFYVVILISTLSSSFLNQHQFFASNAAQHMAQRASTVSAAPPPPPEHIYSTAQLLEAVSAACCGLRDQLQVLSILDATAAAWPGVAAALLELEGVARTAGQRAQAAEASVEHMASQKTQLFTQLNTAKATAAGAVLRECWCMQWQLHSAVDLLRRNRHK